jgi:hypothetical protein
VPKKEEGKTIMQLKINDNTKKILIELAGGERKVGDYLDQIAPDLQAAKERFEAAQEAAQRRAKQSVLAQMMAEQDEAGA